MVELFYLDERKIFARHGLDALTHVRFLKTNIAIISVMMVFGFLIIAPVNGTASNKQLLKTGKNVIFFFSFQMDFKINTILIFQKIRIMFVGVPFFQLKIFLMVPSDLVHTSFPFFSTPR